MLPTTPLKPKLRMTEVVAALLLFVFATTEALAISGATLDRDDRFPYGVHRFRRDAGRQRGRRLAAWRHQEYRKRLLDLEALDAAPAGAPMPDAPASFISPPSKFRRHRQTAAAALESAGASAVMA
jgi:hypothetical protein